MRVNLPFSNRNKPPWKVPAQITPSSSASSEQIGWSARASLARNARRRAGSQRYSVPSSAPHQTDPSRPSASARMGEGCIPSAAPNVRRSVGSHQDNPDFPPIQSRPERSVSSDLTPWFSQGAGRATPSLKTIKSSAPALNHKAPSPRAILADRESPSRRQALRKADHPKAPVPQPDQPAMVDPEPQSAVLRLIPRRDAVARQSIVSGQMFVMAIRGNVKYAIAIMIEPNSAAAIFMHSHAPARRKSQQAAP